VNKGQWARESLRACEGCDELIGYAVDDSQLIYALRESLRSLVSQLERVQGYSTHEEQCELRAARMLVRRAR
jgi:hypothetical protein